MTATSASTLLSMQDVHVRQGERSILKGVSFALEAADRLAIIGANGAGKTTLLRALVGLQNVERGIVTLLGQSCASEPAFRAMRPRIGLLFQDSDDQLFCPSVIEDVAFGPLNTGCSRGEAMARARTVLDDLGVGHLADRLCDRLSGGEKRLVCLAGLLAMRPDVLLLDEPTNGVDSINGRRLRNALLNFSGAMILVSHDDGFIAELATRAMTLSGGVLADAEIHDHPHTHRHIHVHVPEGPANEPFERPAFAAFRPRR